MQITHKLGEKKKRAEKRYFSEEDMKYIIANLGKISTAEIAKHLDRNPNNVRAKIFEMEGKSYEFRMWSYAQKAKRQGEKKKLSRMYVNSLIADIPNSDKDIKAMKAKQEAKLKEVDAVIKGNEELSKALRD